MRVVGLNIDNGRLGVTILQRQFGRTDQLGSSVRSYGSVDELRALLREGAPAWAGAQIVSAVPGSAFTQRSLTFPFADRKRIDKALGFEIEELVPFGIEETVFDHLVLEGGEKRREPGARVLCLMLPKAVLRQHLELLASAGVEPQIVVPSLAGLAAVVRMLPAEGTTLFMNGPDACLTNGGVIRSLRTVRPSATGGMLHVLQALETENKERIARAVLLAPDEAARSALAGAGLAVEHMTPGLGGRAAEDVGSLGAALSAGMNLRKGDLAYRKADEGTRRRRRNVILAASAAAVLFCANVGVKLYVVRSGYNRLDGEIREIYRQAFPDAKESGDPLRQMRDKVAEAKRAYGALASGTSALDVMKTVTEGIPREVRVAFSDFLLEGDRLRLQGEAPSFETVDKIKAELAKSPLFTDVAVQDTRMGVDGKVKFRFEIKLKQAM